MTSEKLVRRTANPPGIIEPSCHRRRERMPKDFTAGIRCKTFVARYSIADSGVT